jgi:hypothetical protein
LRLSAISFLLTAQFSQQMFGVHIPGDELGALTHHFRQNSFPTSPDEGHVREFNNTSALIAGGVKSFPGRAQLDRPITHQAALQGPSLLLGRVGNIDLQHVFLKVRRLRDAFLCLATTGAES